MYGYVGEIESTTKVLEASHGFGRRERTRAGTHRVDVGSGAVRVSMFVCVCVCVVCDFWLLIEFMGVCSTAPLVLSGSCVVW